MKVLVDLFNTNNLYLNIEFYSFLHCIKLVLYLSYVLIVLEIIYIKLKYTWFLLVGFIISPSETWKVKND